jgi:hypothetical protein
MKTQDEKGKGKKKTFYYFSAASFVVTHYFLFVIR